MAILIEGMEMPKNCGGCFLRFGQCSRRIYMENRPSDCPLNEVPEPHGRLIDANVLCNRLEIASRISYEMREAIEYVAKWIVKYVPTVIPESEEG